MNPIVLYTICSAYRLPIPEDTIKMIRIPPQTFGFFITVSKKLEAKIRRDIKYYAAKWKNRNQQQANAFLIMGLAKIEGKVSKTLADICDDLYKNLDANLYGCTISIGGDAHWTTPGVPKAKRISTLAKMDGEEIGRT